MGTVWTAQYQYKGPDRLDITVKTGIKAFAPTWKMVMKSKQGELSEEEHTEQYMALLRKSWKENRAEWENLLGMAEVTLVCFCRPGEFCHRVLLAKLLEQTFGFRYVGERG